MNSGADNIPGTILALREGIEAGLHIGAQVFAMMEGRGVVNWAVGESRLAGDSPGGGAAGGVGGVGMESDTLMLWLSAGKPLTAVATMMLVERGSIALDQPVAAYWPEFAVNGKEGITVRHLLTHTAGIRGVDTAYPFATWEETLARIAEMKIERDWVPGEKAGYHTHTSWYVLGELIRRVTGVACERWVRDEICVPLGMADTWLAMPAEQYAAYGERIGYLYDTSVAPPARPRPLMNCDTELGAGRARPSASARGPMRDLAKFYEMLRCGGALNVEGRIVRVLKPETAALMTARQRVGMFDQTFRQKIDWGLGIILNSAQYGPAVPYQFGPHASAETFGHGGSQSSVGFCDPEKKLVVALLFNGCPGEVKHDRRLRAVLRSLYEELGLA